MRSNNIVVLTTTVHLQHVVQKSTMVIQCGSYVLKPLMLGCYNM